MQRQKLKNIQMRERLPNWEIVYLTFYDAKDNLVVIDNNILKVKVLKIIYLFITIRRKYSLFIAVLLYCLLNSVRYLFCFWTQHTIILYG